MTGSTAAAARIALQGTPNFRDLGGLRTRSGRRLRDGQLFRTEGPAYLLDSDIEQLQRLGLRLVCDLRSDTEREHQPNAWCATTSLNLLNLDVSADLRAGGNAAWKALQTDPSVAGARNAMLHNYRSMPHGMAPHLRILFDHIIGHEEMPALIHCTAGKDRTGFAIAIILHALDVPRETIYADYMLSRRHASAERFGDSIVQAFTATLGFAPNPHVIDALVNVEESYLDTAWSEAEAIAGSFDGYIRDSIGLREDEIEQLRRSLLTD